MARTTFKNDMRVTGALTVDGVVTATGGVTAPVGAATATGGAATLNKLRGKITSESLTTAQNAIYTLTITNSAIAAADLAMASVANGTNTQGTPMIGKVTPGASSLVIEVINKHATAQAFNGTIVVSFAATKAA